MKIKVMDYPVTFSFEINEKLPRFKNGCDIRRQYLLKEMYKQKIDSPCHSYEDYQVEEIERDGQTEYWHLSS